MCPLTDITQSLSTRSFHSVPHSAGVDRQRCTFVTRMTLGVTKWATREVVKNGAVMTISQIQSTSYLHTTHKSSLISFWLIAKEKTFNDRRINQYIQLTKMYGERLNEDQTVFYELTGLLAEKRLC